MKHNVPASINDVLKAIDDYYGKEWLLHYLKAGGWFEHTTTDMRQIDIDGNLIHVYPVDGGIILSIYPKLGTLRKGLKESRTTVIHYIHELYLVKIALNDVRLENARNALEREN